MNKEVRDFLRYQRILTVLNYAREVGSNMKSIRFFDVPKSTFYKCKKTFDKQGKDGIKRKKPFANTHPRALKGKVVERILDLRKTYQMGSWRIKWYVERYHAIEVSESSVYRTLRKYGVNRLSKNVSKRTVHTKQCSKTVPGHHVQVDVKFNHLLDVEGKRIPWLGNPVRYVLDKLTKSSINCRVGYTLSMNEIFRLAEVINMMQLRRLKAQAIVIEDDLAAVRMVQESSEVFVR